MEKLTKNKIRRTICEAGLIKLLLLHGNEKITSNEGMESTIATFLFQQIEDVEFENKTAAAILNICIDMNYKGMPIFPADPIFYKTEAMTLYIKDLLETPYEKQDAGQCDLTGNIVRMAEVILNIEEQKTPILNKIGEKKVEKLLYWLLNATECEFNPVNSNLGISSWYKGFITSKNFSKLPSSKKALSFEIFQNAECVYTYLHEKLEEYREIIEHDDPVKNSC